MGAGVFRARKLTDKQGVAVALTVLNRYRYKCGCPGVGSRLQSRHSIDAVLTDRRRPKRTLSVSQIFEHYSQQLDRSHLQEYFRHFDRPTDVGFGADGKVFVADGYNNTRIAVFSKEGVYQRE